jgi:hypothetical protein
MLWYGPKVLHPNNYAGYWKIIYSSSSNPGNNPNFVSQDGEIAYGPRVSPTTTNGYSYVGFTCFSDIRASTGRWQASCRQMGGNWVEKDITSSTTSDSRSPSWNPSVTNPSAMEVVYENNATVSSGIHYWKLYTKTGFDAD